MNVLLTVGNKLQRTGPGFVAVVKRHGEILKSESVGVADISNSTFIDENTSFRIGSLTKSFTATAIILLAERGRLYLNAPITDFVQGLPEGYDNITLRNLLNHTGGVPDYPNIAGFWLEHSDRDVSPTEAVAYFTTPPLRFAAGQQFEYSNSGYILLGLAIEKVSGARFSDFLRSEFFSSLGMTNTAFLPDEPNPPGLARGYADNEGTFRDSIPMSMTWPYASGALASSTTDLMNWQCALYGGTLISRECLREMMTVPKFPDGSASICGSGCAIGSSGEEAFAYHSGSISGFASYMALRTTTDLQVVVLSNIQSFPAQKLGESLLTEFV